MCDVENRSSVLRITMLGEFSAVYEGRPLNMAYEIQSKIMQLLLLLWEVGDKGVSRANLLQVLYGDDDVLDPSNNLRAIVFRLRRTLISMGLPEDNYISNDKKIYRWNQQNVKLKVDTHEFKKAAERALAIKTDDENRLNLLIEACGLYKGEFLFDLAGTDWVEVKLVEYQDLYFKCLRKTFASLKKRERYEELLNLCRPVAHTYGSEEWVLMLLDCLIKLNRYEEAMEIYHTAANAYFREYGISPSNEMLKRFRQINENEYHNMGEITEVRSQLVENDRNGAYYCGYPSFVDGYHVIGRMAERLGYSAFLMICTVSMKQLKTDESEKRFQEIMEKVRRCIETSMRKGDLFTRYSRNQFLVLLIGITDQACTLVSERIDGNIESYIPAGSIRLDYSITSAIEAGLETPGINNKI